MWKKILSVTRLLCNLWAISLVCFPLAIISASLWLIKTKNSADIVEFYRALLLDPSGKWFIILSSAGALLGAIIFYLLGKVALSFASYETLGPSTTKWVRFSLGLWILALALRITTAWICDYTDQTYEKSIHTDGSEMVTKTLANVFPLISFTKSNGTSVSKKNRNDRNHDYSILAYKISTGYPMGGSVWFPLFLVVLFFLSKSLEDKALKAKQEKQLLEEAALTI